MSLEEVLQYVEVKESGKQSAGRLLQTQGAEAMRSQYRKQQNPSQKPNYKPNDKPHIEACYCCGKQDHGHITSANKQRQQECPAFGTFCQLCGRPNQFATACKSKKDSLQLRTSIPDGKGRQTEGAIFYNLCGVTSGDHTRISNYYTEDDRQAVRERANEVPTANEVPGSAGADKQCLPVSKPLVISTYNVRTLYQEGKNYQLFMGCADAGIDIIGIQEHRLITTSPTDELWSDDKNWVLAYSSASDNRQGGVGFLMSKHVRKCLQSIESVNERILTATFYGNPLVTITTVYASDADKEEFYLTLKSHLEKILQVPFYRDLLLSYKTGVVIEVKQFDQYATRVNGSGRITLRNRKVLRQYVPVQARPPLSILSDDLRYTGKANQATPSKPSSPTLANQPTSGAQPPNPSRSIDPYHANRNQLPTNLEKPQPSGPEPPQPAETPGPPWTTNTSNT
ncbi:hypothetical protein AC249_AIPGENE1517 [Exaiptasia diaphana]|nr:hypothetical protein AC249_AIPGENE1517 [Exaiptasia diaphana]